MKRAADFLTPAGKPVVTALSKEAQRGDWLELDDCVADFAEDPPEVVAGWWAASLFDDEIAATRKSQEFTTASLLRGAVIEALGAPEITCWQQARFYGLSAVTVGNANTYAAALWFARHPEERRAWIEFEQQTRPDFMPPAFSEEELKRGLARAVQAKCARLHLPDKGVLH